MNTSQFGLGIGGSGSSAAGGRLLHGFDDDIVGGYGTLGHLHHQGGGSSSSGLGLYPGAYLPSPYSTPPTSAHHHSLPHQSDFDRLPFLLPGATSPYASYHHHTSSVHRQHQLQQHQQQDSKHVSDFYGSIATDPYLSAIQPSSTNKSTSYFNGSNASSTATSSMSGGGVMEITTSSHQRHQTTAEYRKSGGSDFVHGDADAEPALRRGRPQHQAMTSSPASSGGLVIKAENPTQQQRQAGGSSGDAASDIEDGEDEDEDDDSDDAGDRGADSGSPSQGDDVAGKTASSTAGGAVIYPWMKKVHAGELCHISYCIV